MTSMQIDVVHSTWQKVMPILQEMTDKYVQCGMKVDSKAVRNPLISTLEQHLGETLTEDIRSDWIQAYDVLVGVMKDALTEKLLMGLQTNLANSIQKVIPIYATSLYL